MRVVFVANPRSAGGGTGARLDAVRKLAAPLFPSMEIVLTERPGHAIELAERLGAEADVLISVGGDGTANEVVNGLARLPRERRPALGVLPAGTGSDLVKTLCMPSDLPDALGVLARGKRRAIDWMRVGFQTPEGELERICINVAGFGMSGEVVKRANDGKKRFGGRVTFALATARTAATWRAPRVAVAWDGPDGPGEWVGPLASVFAANGQYCGGGMWVGRGGSMSDGFVELTILPELPLARSALGAPRLYTGSIGRVKGVVTARAAELSARPVDGREILLDLDGEQPGNLPIRLVVEPRAIDAIGQWVG